MENKIPKIAQYKRMETILLKQFLEWYINQEPNSNDLKYKRMIELGNKHLPLKDIVKILEQEFPEK